MDMNFLAIACCNIETIIAEVRMNLPLLLRYGNNCEGKSAIFFLIICLLWGRHRTSNMGRVEAEYIDVALDLLAKYLLGTMLMPYQLPP